MHPANLFCFLFSALLCAAPNSQQTASQKDATVRVKVALVQTDVMVFDKQGRFVPDLKKDQFRLFLDGKEQPIEFFEMISAGSPHDEQVWAKTETRANVITKPPTASTQNPGRTLLFFIDDWHMSSDSVMRARIAMSSLIETSVSSKDRVAIFAASGQLGSAQELVSDKAVLLARLEKFNYLSPGVEDLSWPPMTDSQALLIEQKDEDAITFFVGAFLRKNIRVLPPRPDGEIRDAIDAIKRKASAIAQLSCDISERSLAALRNLIGAAQELPGRKLVFFLSDGFSLHPQRGDIISRIGTVTTAAARAGVVVYTLDTRGLVVGLLDAKRPSMPDPTAFQARTVFHEVSAPMDALNALAADTGGRFLKDTNALDAAMIKTLEEVSRYYLLAWHFDPGSVKPGKWSSIRVTLKDRSGLRVNLRNGYLDLSQLVKEKKKSASLLRNTGGDF